jgi:4a-hydroxytetrahydrobiopterin dehydratase
MNARHDVSQSEKHAKGQSLTKAAVADFLQDLPDWDVVTQDGHLQLVRSFSFPDFVTALAFTNAVGEVAEALDHHPTLVTTWGSVTVTWWSHDADGVTKRDIRAARRTDECYEDSDVS